MVDVSPEEACQIKRVWGTPALAQTVADWLNDDPDNDLEPGRVVTIYECRVEGCDGWHLTSTGHDRRGEHLMEDQCRPPT